MKQYLMVFLSEETDRVYAIQSLFALLLMPTLSFMHMSRFYSYSALSTVAFGILSYSFDEFNFLFALLLMYVILSCVQIIVHSGGALKPTDVDTLWVHVTCALFQPEVCFADTKKMEPASGTLSIPSNSFVKVGI